MHIRKLLHKLFLNTAQFVDKRNHKTLIEAVVTLCDCKPISISALGRSLQSQAYVKHNIKRIDRLFGNPEVQNSAIHYYQ